MSLEKKTNNHRYLAVLLLIWLTAAQSRMARAEVPVRWPYSLAEFYLVSWMPELREFNPPRGSPEDELLEMARMVQRGQINEAEQRLKQFRTRAVMLNDFPRQALSSLWRQVFAQQRTRWAGAGWAIDGAALADLPNREEATRIVGEQLNPLYATSCGIQVLSAYKYCAIGSDYMLESQAAAIRQVRFPYYEEGRSYMRSKTHLSDSAETLKRLEPGVADDVQRGLLDAVTAQLYLHLVRAGFAKAEERNADCEYELGSGVTLAKANGRRHTAAMFEIRLGDLHAFPYGSARTMGMSLGDEGDIRVTLRTHQIPPPLHSPAETALTGAESHYREASRLLTETGDSTQDADLSLREALIARHRQQNHQVEEKLKLAISQAVAAGDVAMESFSRSALALWSGQRDEFQKAFQIAMDAGDIGTALSIGECAVSWAIRFAEVALDPWAGLARLQMARRAYQRYNLKKEEELLTSEELSIYDSLGQTDKSLEISQRLLALSRLDRDKELSEQVRSDWMSRLSSLVNAANDALLREPFSDRWQKRRDEALEEYARMAEQTSDNDQQKLVQKSRALSQMADLYARLRRAQGQADYKGRYEAIRQEAEKLHDLQLLMAIDSAACNAIPAARERLRASVTTLEPVKALRKALEQSKGANSSFADNQEAQRLWSSLSVACQAAVISESWLTLSRWLDEMDDLSTVDDHFRQQWKIPMVFLRAQTNLAVDQPQEALRRLESLWKDLHLSDSEIGPREQPKILQTTLSILLSAQIASGVDADQCFHTLIQLDIETERMREYGTALRKNVFDSAEVAMLRRQSSIDGGLSEPEAKRLTLLEKESQETLSQDLDFPLKSMQKSLAELPVSLLVHHMDRGKLVTWLIEPGRGIQMKRTDTPLPVVQREINQFYKCLRERYPGWKQASEHLYSWLVAPLAPHSSTRRLVVAGDFGALPFDLLGEKNEPLIMEKIAVSHLPTLAIFARKSEVVPLGGKAPALVAGVNDASLSAAEAEAESVARIFDTKPLLGAQASCNALLNALPQARWIFFAGHASMVQTNPFLSYLHASDGPVAAWQLFRAVARPELVVLSACETSGPSIGAGLDYSNSSLSSFASAGGARWTVGSLWKAPDESTREVVVEFARGLREQHLSVDEALRRAKYQSYQSGLHPGYFGHFSLFTGQMTTFDPR